MAIKAAINPRVAVAERPATLSGAMNFISGGQTLGTSIVASAANKIVGFQRGAAAVAPKPPDLGSIINTLSTNILSNVDNKVKSINNNIQQVIQNQFQKQIGEYQQKVNELSSNPPNKILQNFLSLYKEAIGYIQFLGNRKNIKRLGENLEALQNVFSETFRIAALVRTTIVKIVGQLSNLPAASSGPGGINLDVSVPGGPLRRTMPRGKGGRLGMLGMGAAIAGAGALGSKVVSGMMDVGGGVQPDTTGVASSIPTLLLDRFMEVLNRFDRALQGFQAPKPAPSTPTAPSAQKPKDKDGGGGGAGGGKGVNAGDITADTAEEKAFIATVREAEGTAGAQGYNTFFGGSQYGGDLSTKTVMEVKQLQEKFLSEGKGTYGNKKSAAVGAGQFLYPEQIVKEMGMDPSKVKFTPELQNQMILYLAKKKRGVDVSKELTAADFKILGKEWAGLSEYHGQGGSVGKTQQLYQQNLKEARGTVKAVGGPEEDAAKIEAQIRASTDQSQLMKGIAGDVSQPAVSTDQQSNVSIVPLVLGSPQSNSTPTGSQVAAPPVMSKAGATIQFLSSSNDDNFFTILSKVVYNIVDG